MPGHLKRELKDLIGKNDPEQVFRRLRSEILRADCDLYDDIILIQSRYNQNVRESHLGIIDDSERNRTLKSLLWLINEITIDDLNDSSRQAIKDHVYIPVYHAYTCNRSKQLEIIEEHYHLGDPAQKITHFYLHGDSRQAMSTLYERIGYEISGHYNLHKGNKDYIPNKIKFIPCKPAIYGSPKLLLLKIIRELMAKFGLNPPSQHLLSSKLTETLNAPSLRGETPQAAFNANDHVFVLLVLDHYNWGAFVIKEVMETFINSFCNCVLPENSPKFSFFYGIEYPKEDVAIQKAMKNHIAEAEQGIKLEELKPVSINDIETWLSDSDHKTKFVPYGKTTTAIAQELFPEATAIDMEDVVHKFGRLIDRHNKSLLPDY